MAMQISLNIRHTKSITWHWT